MAVDPVPDGGIAVLKIRDFEGDVVVYRSAALNPETGRVAFKVTMSTDLPPIEYTVTATYLGTEAFDGSVSDPLTIKVNPNSTDTRLDIVPVRPFGALVPGGDAKLQAMSPWRSRWLRPVLRDDRRKPGRARDRQADRDSSCCGGPSGFANLTMTDVLEGEHTYLAEFLGSMIGQPSSESVTAAFEWGVRTRLSLGTPDDESRAGASQRHLPLPFRRSGRRRPADRDDRPDRRCDR